MKYRPLVDFIPHMHLEAGEIYCPICIAVRKRESAQMMRNVLLRMKLALANGQEFVFDVEAAEPIGRSNLYEQWNDLNQWMKEGQDFENVEFGRTHTRLSDRELQEAA